MYAQVTTTLIGVARLNDFIEQYRRFATDLREASSDFKALFLLVDRSDGKVISLLLNDDPARDPNSENRVFDAGSIYDQLAMTPPVHEEFTVPLFTMFTFTPTQFRKRPRARVTIARSDPDSLEQATTIMRDKVIPAAKEEQGFKGLAALLNQDTGKSMTVTLWETEEDLEDSEISGYYQQQLSRFARILSELPLREYFEVAIHIAGA